MRRPGPSTGTALRARRPPCRERWLLAHLICERRSLGVRRSACPIEEPPPRRHPATRTKAFEVARPPAARPCPSSWSRVRGSNSPPHDYKSDRRRPADGALYVRARKHATSGAGAVRRARSVACRDGLFVDTSWTARVPDGDQHGQVSRAQYSGTARPDGGIGAAIIEHCTGADIARSRVSAGRDSVWRECAILTPCRRFTSPASGS